MAPRAERDRGVVGAVEMLYLLLFGLAAILFIGYLGRLHAAGVQVAHASQAAARLASQAPSSAAAESAAWRRRGVLPRIALRWGARDVDELDPLRERDLARRVRDRRDQLHGGQR